MLVDMRRKFAHKEMDVAACCLSDYGNEETDTHWLHINIHVRSAQ